MLAVLGAEGGAMEPSATSGVLPAKLPSREPSQVFILAAVGIIATAAILVPNLRLLVDAVASRGPELLLWSVLIVVVNLFFHFENRALQFTLDVPLVLAASALYAPAVVAAMALVSEVDVREVGRRVSIPRAIYNRTQITISAFAASTVFHAVGGLEQEWPMALAAMGLAWGTFYVLNGAFVSMLVSIREGIPPYRVLRFLRVGRSVEFILTYLGYGIFALVLARLFREIGPWSVVLFLVPLLVAHVALVRAEKLFGMARTLQDRERLLELLSNRMVEERRDERLRIASDLHQLVDDSQRTLDSLRSVISDLKQSPLGRGGLIQTVDQLVRDLRLDWGKRVEFHPGNLDPSELSPDTQLVAYQVVREGLVNALKHSQASSIEAEIRMTHAYLRVTIRDDGIGFDPAEVDTSRHFGLGLMQERLRLSGTQLSIRTRPGGGCEIEADLPLDR